MVQRSQSFQSWQAFSTHIASNITKAHIHSFSIHVPVQRAVHPGTHSHAGTCTQSIITPPHTQEQTTHKSCGHGTQSIHNQFAHSTHITQGRSSGRETIRIHIFHSFTGHCQNATHTISVTHTHTHSHSHHTHTFSHIPTRHSSQFTIHSQPIHQHTSHSSTSQFPTGRQMPTHCVTFTTVHSQVNTTSNSLRQLSHRSTIHWQAHFTAQHNKFTPCILKAFTHIHPCFNSSFFIMAQSDGAVQIANSQAHSQSTICIHFTHNGNTCNTFARSVHVHPFNFTLAHLMQGQSHHKFSTNNRQGQHGTHHTQFQGLQHNTPVKAWFCNHMSGNSAIRFISGQTCKGRSRIQSQGHNAHSEGTGQSFTCHRHIQASRRHGRPNSHTPAVTNTMQGIQVIHNMAVTATLHTLTQAGTHKVATSTNTHRRYEAHGSDNTTNVSRARHTTITQHSSIHNIHRQSHPQPQCS